MRMRISSRILAIVLSGLSGPAALAQGGPPLRTDDPGTPGDGNWEINIAFTVESLEDETELEVPLLDINYGVGDAIQLKFELPWIILHEDGEGTKHGLGNSTLGVKWRFLDEDPDGLSMSVYPQFEFKNPTSSGDRGIVDDRMELFRGGAKDVRGEFGQPGNRHPASGRPEGPVGLRARRRLRGNALPGSPGRDPRRRTDRLF